MQVHQGISVTAIQRPEVSSSVTTATPRPYSGLAAKMRPHFNSYGTKRAEMPINNSARPYQRNRDRATAPPRRTRIPAPHEPKAQTSHEHGHDYRNQSCRNPETSHRKSQPNNLVHQAAEARDDKEDESTTAFLAKRPPLADSPFSAVKLLEDLGLLEFGASRSNKPSKLLRLYLLPSNHNGVPLTDVNR